ncbi:MAG: hypothetical protein ACI3VX_03760, partial [Faecousia sp.]
MKKRLLSILLTACLLVGLLPTAALAAGPDVWDGSTQTPSGGGKSESDPYLISTGEELAWLATLEAEGSYFVKLTNDIILNEGTFDSNGNLSTSSTPHAWTPAPKAVWHIDGNNHYISGMYINSNEGNVGLFSYLYGYSYSKGYVRDLTIKNSYVRLTRDNPQYGNGKAGVFAGESFRTEYTNCFSENNIVSTNCYATGGIVGSSQDDTFNGVHTSGSISGSNSLGGLAGMVSYDSVFKNCWNEASIPSGSYCGGIVGDGRNSSDYYNCANLGSGGITGSGGRTFKNCYNLSEVDGYGGAERLLATLNDNLYEMDGISDLNTWVMGTGGYPLPTGDTFVDTTVYYNIWLDGVRVGERNQDNILKNNLASYDKDTNTLYLHDGLVVTNPYNESLLYTEGDINLCVDGSVEFRSAQNVGSGPSVIKLGASGGSGNLKIYAQSGKSAAVTVTGAYSEYGINVNSLTLDGDVCLTVRTYEPCFAFAYTFTLLSSEAVLDAENLSGGHSMLNFVSSVNLPSTNPQKLYEGTGTDLTCVNTFTTKNDNEDDYMYPHIRIAPEVYGLSDTLPKSLTVSMTEANTEAALSTWAAGQIRKGDITASNSEITVSDVVPAVAGSNANESGTDGSFTVTVKLTKNGISKTTTIPGTITATAYVPAHTHCVCGGDTDVGDHTTHTDVTYQEWDGTSAISYTNNVAYVYLADNAEITSNVLVQNGKTLYLCLNGKEYKSTGTDGKNKFVVTGGGHLILCDCQVVGTVVGGSGGDEGGCVYLSNSTMDLFGGKLTGGSAKNGGAIAVVGNGTLNLYGGEISGNTASECGGAVYLKDGSLNLSGNPVVKDNTVSDKANNIYLKSGKTLSIVGDMTTGAEIGISTESTTYPVVFSDANDVNYADCFFADDENVTVEYNSDKKLELASGTPTHTHNWATDWTTDDTNHWHECTVEGCDVTDNSLKDSYGKHVYDDDTDTVCNICGYTRTIEPPHTHCICGGDTDVGDHTTHTDVTYQPWDGTSAIDYGDDNTAYVYLTGDVTIQNNLEIEEGKTLYLCLNGKTFASNGTKKIETRENSRFILCDCAGGGTIDGADSSWGGAGIYLHNSTMDMYGGKITGGYASGNGGGGAIALDDVNCVFNMYGGEISGNKAYRYGGAIFLNGTLQTNKGGTVNIYGGTISGNSAKIGGAIYSVYGGTVNLYGGEISGNTATVNGGGAICLNHSGVLNMTGGKMQNNTAKTDGGAVNLYASTFTFSGGTISNNYSAEYGGAIYLSISCKLYMTGGEICNNTAAEEGGAVHVYGQNSFFNLSAGTITGNEAKDGGAVYLNQENSTLNMTGGEISGNKASRNGGAVYMFRAMSTLNLSGGTIKNNTAGSSGGAVYFNTTSDGKIQGVLNISGNPVVKDNTVSDKANNIAMKTGKTLSIVGDMTDGASVGITTESTNYPIVFSNAYDTDYKDCFFADDATAHVEYNADKKLQLAHTHNLTLVPGKPAGCTTPGNTAYYVCDGCEKWFEDAEGELEITDKDSVVIPAGHSWN